MICTTSRSSPLLPDLCRSICEPQHTHTSFAAALLWRRHVLLLYLIEPLSWRQTISSGFFSVSTSLSRVTLLSRAETIAQNLFTDLNMFWPVNIRTRTPASEFWTTLIAGSGMAYTQGRPLGGASRALAPGADFEGAPKMRSPTGHALIRSTIVWWFPHLQMKRVAKDFF
jgi:hypothetical protein